VSRKGEREAARRELAALAAGWKDPAPPAPAPDENAPREALIHASLGVPLWLILTLALVTFPGYLVGAIFLSAAIVGSVNGLTVLLVFAAVGGAFFGQIALLTRPVSRLLARRQRRWLDALPLPFDRAVYLRVLGTEHLFTATVTLVVEPAEEIDDEARTLLAHAATRACRGNKAVWSKGGMQITSRELKTSQSGGRGAGTVYDNHAIHAWFRRAARRFLLPTARAYRLERLLVRA
jgi:hypothetical protein